MVIRADARGPSGCVQSALRESLQVELLLPTVLSGRTCYVPLFCTSIVTSRVIAFQGERFIVFAGGVSLLLQGRRGLCAKRCVIFVPPSATASRVAVVQVVPCRDNNRACGGTPNNPGHLLRFIADAPHPCSACRCFDASRVVVAEWGDSLSRRGVAAAEELVGAVGRVHGDLPLDPQPF